MDALDGEVRLGGRPADSTRHDGKAPRTDGHQRWVVASLVALFVMGILVGVGVLKARQAEERLTMELYQKNPRRIRELIRSGLSIHYRRGDQATFLTIAAEIGDPELIREVLRRGGRLEDRDHIGSTALLSATRPKAIRALVKAGARIDSANDFGYTALISAAQDGELEAVRTLLELGANPTLKTTHGQTALDCAKAGEAWNVVRFLHRYGIRR